MTSKLLFRHTNLVTMTEATGFGEIMDGALAVRDGKICWLGRDSELPKDAKADHEIDGGGAWLTPGLVDCHTHLVWAGNRADEFERRLNGESYQSIAATGGGIRSTVRTTRAASHEDLFAHSAPRLKDLIREGVTTVEIKSGYGLDLDTELKMLSVAKRLGETHNVRVEGTYLGAHAVPWEFEGRSDDYVRMIRHDHLPQVRASGLATSVDAFCESIAFNSSQVRKILSDAKRLGFNVKLHADQLSDSGSAGLIAEMGGLSADHVEYASEASVRAMSSASTVAVLLPGAYYSLHESHKPPVESFRRGKVSMAVATDCNPGTSPCSSLLLMVNMACVLFGLTPSEALAGTTRCAAQALGLADRIGRLEVGLEADLALFDIDHPRDIAANIGANRCVASWRAGSQLHSGGT
ncbi:MAG: imidazolonepropionase [Fimbriimonas sp.]|nr:imidazolonepropionase [Fimbriimonas sp.]